MGVGGWDRSWGKRGVKELCASVVKYIFFQNELMVEIYSKSLVRAIGKVLLMKLR